MNAAPRRRARSECAYAPGHGAHVHHFSSPLPGTAAPRGRAEARGQLSLNVDERPCKKKQKNEGRWTCTQYAPALKKRASQIESPARPVGLLRLRLARPLELAVLGVERALLQRLQPQREARPALLQARDHPRAGAAAALLLALAGGLVLLRRRKKEKEEEKAEPSLPGTTNLRLEISRAAEKESVRRRRRPPNPADGGPEGSGFIRRAVARLLGLEDVAVVAEENEVALVVEGDHPPAAAAPHGRRQRVLGGKRGF